MSETFWFVENFGQKMRLNAAGGFTSSWLRLLFQEARDAVAVAGVQEALQPALNHKGCLCRRVGAWRRNLKGNCVLTDWLIPMVAETIYQTNRQAFGYYAEELVANHFRQNKELVLSHGKNHLDEFGEVYDSSYKQRIANLCDELSNLARRARVLTPSGVW